MNLSRRTLIIIGGILVVLILLVVTIITRGGQGSTNATPTPTASPTLVMDLPAKGPNLPTYYNFNSLLDIGISTDQLDAIKYGLAKYLNVSGKKSTKIIMTAGSLKIIDASANHPANSLTFEVKYDFGVLNAQADYSNLTAARVYLIDPKTGSQIFDSQTIDLFNGLE